MRHQSLLIQLQSPRGEWIDVGVLHHQDEKNWFEFSVEYWNMPERPVLGQIFEEHGRAWRPTARMSLPHWFSHLLPEGRQREAVAQSAHVHTKREFQLLSRLGLDDLPGAVRALAVDPRAGSQVPEELDLTEAPSPIDPILKFSLAGVQLKFSVLGDRDENLVVPVAGETGKYILKFPDNRPGYRRVPEAEYACLELARSIGISTPEARLVPTESVQGLEDWAAAYPGNALAVRRFDRDADGSRIHMEEVAQVVNISASTEGAKYEKANFELIATVIGGLTDTAAVAEVIDRLVLNIFVGNGDAHLKNWALTYPDGLNAALSPVYDVVPTILYLDGDDFGLKLGGTKDFGLLTPGSFRRLGERTEFGARQAELRAKETAVKIAEQWSLMSDYFDAPAYELLTKRQERLSLRFAQ